MHEPSLLRSRVGHVGIDDAVVDPHCTSAGLVSDPDIQAPDGLDRVANLGWRRDADGSICVHDEEPFRINGLGGLLSPLCFRSPIDFAIVTGWLGIGSPR